MGLLLIIPAMLLISLSAISGSLESESAGGNARQEYPDTAGVAEGSSMGAIVPGNGIEGDLDLPIPLSGSPGSSLVRTEYSAGSYTLVNSSNWFTLMTPETLVGTFSVLVLGNSTNVHLQLMSAKSFPDQTSVYYKYPIQRNPGFVCSFQIWMNGGFSGDELFFYAGAAAPVGCGVSCAAANAGYNHGGVVLGLDVNILNYGGAGQYGTGIYLMNGAGMIVAAAPFLGNSAWETVSITYTKGTSNTWVVTWKGSTVITYSDSSNPSWAASAGSYWGFGAVSGGLIGVYGQIQLSGDFYLSQVQLTLQRNSTLVVTVMVLSSYDSISSVDNCHSGKETSLCTLRAAISYCAQVNQQTALMCHIFLPEVDIVSITSSIVIDTASSTLQFDLHITGNAAVIQCAASSTNSCLIQFLVVHGWLNSFTMTNVTVTGFNPSMLVKGSALYIEAVPDVVLSGVKFVNNAGSIGGSLHIDSTSRVSIENCSFRDNSALVSGGALFISDVSEVEITNSEFAHNRVSALGNPGLVSTLAGSGRLGSIIGGAYADGTGTEAAFNIPESVALDAFGNVFVADWLNNRIRIVSPAGEVSTLPFPFNKPQGVAVDAVGNVFVTEQGIIGTFRIRKMSFAGVVTTLAGLYQGYMDGVGTNAQFRNPSGIAVDTLGNIIIADQFNNVIRKISPAGLVTTLAGLYQGYMDGVGTNAQFRNPSGIAVDTLGNIIVADNANNVIRKISPAGNVTTLAGSYSSGYADGLGTTALFNSPFGVAVDRLGNVLVADTFNDVIRAISPSGVVTSLAGYGRSGSYTDGIGSDANFNRPNGLAVDAYGNIVVADQGNNCIRIISPSQGNGGAMNMNSVSLVRISNCSLLDNTAAGSGGAIHVSNSDSVVMSNSAFSRNQAQLGGGVSFHGVTNTSIGVEMKHCLLEGNRVRNAGGGIATGMNLHLLNTSMRNNQAIVGVGYNNSDHMFIRRLRGLERGGGIYVYSANASIVLNGVVLSRNRAGDRGGGALHVDNTGNSIVIWSSLVELNTASGPGAGICIAALTLVEVVDTIIANNTVQTYDNRNLPHPDSGHGHGGGMFLSGSCKKALLIRCSFIGNVAQGSGGGLLQAYIEDSFELNLWNCTFLGNVASHGGAVAFSRTSPSHGPSSARCTTRIFGSKFDGNMALKNGGALYFPSGIGAAFVPQIRSSMFVSNKANSYGGGLYSANNIDMYDTTISWGGAYSGGGMYFDSGSNGTKSNLERVLMYKNRAQHAGGGIYVADNAGDVSFVFSTLDDNSAAIGGGIVCGAPAVNNSYTLTNSNVNSNVANNGAGVYLSSSSGSAERGSVVFTDCRIGNNAAAASGGGIFLDSTVSKIFFRSSQILNNSAQTGGGLYLMPSLENLFWTGGSFTSNSASGSGGGVYVDRHCRNITFQNASWVSNVAVLYGGGIYLDSYTQSITVDKCTMSRNEALGGGAVAVMSFNHEFSIFDTYITDNSARYSGGGVYISILNTNIVVSNCSYLRNKAVKGDGGAMLVEFSNAVIALSSCRFISNIAAVFGGGVIFVAQNRYITIERTTFQSNNAYAGGAVTFYRDANNIAITQNSFDRNNVTTIGGAVYISLDCSDLYISNTTFSKNSAIVNGGAMYVDRKTADLIISNSYFVSNTAKGDGAAVYFSQYNSLAGIQSTVFDRNSAMGSGGGVYLDLFNDVHFRNCTFSSGKVETSGAGLYGFYKNTVVIVASKFLKNYALTDSGGALAFQGYNSITIYSSVFADNNAATYGGGIALISGNSNITMQSCTFTRNYAAGYGGSMYVYGSDVLRIVDSSCTHSTALFDGGCIYVSTTRLVRIDNFVVFAGVSGLSAGAAIATERASVTAFSGTSRAATSATGRGGALYVSGCSDIEVFRSTLMNCVSDNGGAGVFLTSCPKASLRNCTFAANTCPSSAGSGLYLTASNVSVDKLRFTGNSATGGGVFFWDASTMPIPNGTETSIWFGSSSEPSVSTSVTRISSPHSVFVSRRHENTQRIPTITVKLFDYYGQIMANENSAIISVNLTHVKGCEASSAPLVGTPSVIVSNGEATFSTLTSDCEPEGSITLRFVLIKSKEIFSSTTTVYFPTNSPTTSPTKQPTPEPQPVLSFGGIVGVCSVVVITLLLILAYYIYYVRYSDKAKKEAMIMERLRQLPLHSFLLTANKRSTDLNANDDLFLSLIADHPEHIRELDYNEQTPLDIILNKKNVIPITSRSVVGILNADIEPLVAPELSCIEWCKAVYSNDDIVVMAVQEIVRLHKPRISFLANCKDERGRRARDLADRLCKEVILKALFLHERYEVNPGLPEHQSATSLVVIAIDHNDDVSSGNGERVALKLMKNRDHYLSEVRNRDDFYLSSNFIIPILRAYDGDARDSDNVAFRTDAVSKGYSDYPFCIVMEAAALNLKRVIDQHFIAGHAWSIIRAMVDQLALCLRHLHGNDLVHGDLKPANVLQMHVKLKLIDFDASVRIGENIGKKCSSCYVPPEMITVVSGGSLCSRVIANTPGYNLLPAAPSFDMWGLGCIMYLLCTGTMLFPGSVEDTIVEESVLHDLFEWPDSLKERKLNAVADRTARNLLSLLLNKDPEKRPNASRVLSHPFLMGSAPARLPGEKAVWDVFISYRVDSDDYHAEVLYEECKKQGLKVWLDSKCLHAGQNWLFECCRALIGSSVVVCVISRRAINHPTIPSLNFEKIQKQSPCDVLLLEWRLAVEAKKHGMVETIVPVLVGDMDTNAEYNNYFRSDCGPTGVVDVMVDSVETAFRECLNREGLGVPFEDLTVKAVHDTVLSNQGKFIEGDLNACVAAIVSDIIQMQSPVAQRTTQRYRSNLQLNEENRQLREEVRILKDENTLLKVQMQN